MSIVKLCTTKSKLTMKTEISHQAHHNTGTSLQSLISLVREAGKALVTNYYNSQISKKGLMRIMF